MCKKPTAFTALVQMAVFTADGHIKHKSIIVYWSDLESYVDRIAQIAISTNMTEGDRFLIQYTEACIVCGDERTHAHISGDFGQWRRNFRSLVYKMMGETLFYLAAKANDKQTNTKPTGGDRKQRDVDEAVRQTYEALFAKWTLGTETLPPMANVLMAHTNFSKN